MNNTNTTLPAQTDGPSVIYGNSAYLPLYTVWIFINVVLVVWRRKYQPVKSRSSLLMLLSLFTSYILILLLGLRYAIGRLLFPCLVYMTTFFLSVPGVFLPTTIRCWRLLLIYTHSRLKLAFAHDDKTGQARERTRIRILNVLTSPQFIFGLVVALFAIHTIIMFVSLGILTAVDPILYFTFTAGCYMPFSILAIVVAQVLIYMFFMILSAILLLVTKANDAWGIRVEVIFSVINFTFWSTLYFVLNVIPAYQDYPEYIFPAGSCVYAVCLIDNIMTCFIPCCRSFIVRNNYTFRNLDDNSRDSRLFMVLSNDEYRHAFKKYGMQSFCPEAIMFWEESQAFRRLTDENAKLELVSNIINRFLDSASPLELNLENKKVHVKKLLDLIQRYEQYAEEIPIDCFHELEIIVRKDMLDLFYRFEATGEYLLIKRSSQSNMLLRRKTLSTFTLEDTTVLQEGKEMIIP
jgi:hypothetical protein